MNDTLEMSTVSTLALFETNKAQRLSFAEDVVNKIVNEEADPIKVQLYIKSMEDIINTLTSTDEKKNKRTDLAKQYREVLLSAAEKHGKKFQLHNAEFSIKEAGTVYDFSQCNDTAIIDLLAQQEEIKAKVKERQDFLKALPLSGMNTVNEETGEMVTLYPPSKSSTTALAVSLK